jgi:hypothetical protein
MLARDSSTVSPCEQQPGRVGTATEEPPSVSGCRTTFKRIRTPPSEHCRWTGPWSPTRPGYRRNGVEAELLAGLPFVNMELVDQEAFQQFTERIFATDGDLVPKGTIEVVL